VGGVEVEGDGCAPAGAHMTTTTRELLIPAHTQRREPISITDDHSISVDHYYIPQHYTGLIDYLLITKGNILDRVERLACDILDDYPNTTVHLVCVLKGTLSALDNFVCV
jgi:hypothetical protein